MHKTVANKLFFNRYKHKIVLNNSLASIFRGKNFDFARRMLDNVGNSALYPYRYSNSAVYGQHCKSKAMLLLNELKKVDKKSYALRIFFYEIGIYSNDKQWLNHLGHLHGDIIQFTSVVNDIGKDAVLRKNITKYEYCVYFSTKCGNPEFARFVENNDNFKAGAVTINALKNKQDVSGLYFYAKDEKNLMLAKMMIGDNIRKINRVVTE